MSLQTEGNGNHSDLLSQWQTDITSLLLFKKFHDRDLPGGPMVRNQPCNAGVLGLIPGGELRYHMPSDS